MIGLFLLIAFLGQIAPATDADLAQAEEAFEHAARNRQTETLARLVHQDFFWIDADGTQQTSGGFLRHIKESADIDVDSNVQTRSYGATAIAFGETRDSPYAQRFTRIWVRTSAGWRLFAYQKTSIVPNQNASQPQANPAASTSRDETNFIVNTTARTSAEREVVDALRGVQRAEHAPDWSGWAALTVDEFQVVNVRGHVDLKANRIKTIRQQAQSTPFPIVRDLRIRMFGNTAVMTAIQEPALASPFKFTRLWVKTNGGWKQVINHQTPTITLSARQVAAQTDPRSPTNPSDPLKVLVDKLNDPQRGAALRAQWNIDRAVWNEPVTAVRNGVTVLVTPAHADIHTSIDSARAVWSSDGPLISASHNPTSARLFIPRGYQNQTVPRRMVSFAPGGDSTEYTFEPAYGVRSPVLRRGYVLCVINAWSSVATPIPLAQWGPHLNEIVVFAQRLLTSGLSLPRPTFTYAWGESRGARMLAYASELAGTPFNSVIENRGGGDLVESALEQIQMLRELRTVNPADDPVLADYMSKIGRRMKITTRNADSHEEFIPISPGDDERFFFKLPPTANVLMPIIPPYSDSPLTASDPRFRVPAGGGNRSGGDNPFDGTLAWSAGPINTRRFLNEVDPAYAAAVDSGRFLLKSWDPKTRPAEVRDAIARLTSSGQIKTKILKVHGTLDPNIYPLTAVAYVQKIVDQNLSNQLRWYLVPGMGHVRSTLEEKFVDANGKTISLGVQLSHLDLLMNWVEKAIDPGDFISIDPTDPTNTLAVKGAHQLGLQKSPLQYFWTASGTLRSSSAK